MPSYFSQTMTVEAGTVYHETTIKLPAGKKLNSVTVYQNGSHTANFAIALYIRNGYDLSRNSHLFFGTLGLHVTLTNMNIELATDYESILVLELYNNGARNKTINLRCQTT